MRRLIGLGILLFLGVAGWRVGETLSSDAVGMAVGLLLGVMAGVPTALLVLASHRNAQRYEQPQRWTERPQQPPKIEHHHHYHIHGDFDARKLPRALAQLERKHELEAWDE